MRLSLLASFGFLPSAALVSVWDGGGCLLACSYAVGRFRPAVCDARFLWIASLRLPGLLRHGILSLCREGG